MVNTESDRIIVTIDPGERILSSSSCTVNFLHQVPFRYIRIRSSGVDIQGV